MQYGNRSRYLPILLYVIGLNTLIIGTVAVLHEFGHATAGYLMGCTNIEVVLLSQGYAPYTKMLCTTANDPGAVLMAASAFFFVLPLALLFYAQTGLKERHIGHIILGVSIIAAAHDIQHVFPGTRVGLLVIGIGAVIGLYGEDRLIHGIIATEMPPVPRKH